MDFSAYQSKRMLTFFEELTAIPRPSHHEEKMAAYLCAFASDRGLYHEKDEANNVLIRVPGTKGREGEPTVLLQGHTDMVCEAEDGVSWDTENEGVTLLRDGDWLFADKTTLGGDDGAAVAAMMAAADGAIESHPPLELLFTTGEEVGLCGMKAFELQKLTARRMINLDSELEGEAIISCAGGVRTDITLKSDFCSFDKACVKIGVRGLAGGHSGADIGLGRASASKVLADVLKELVKDTKVSLASVEGGSKDNAIMRSAQAVLSVPRVEEIVSRVEAMKQRILLSLSPDDRQNFSLSVERAEAPDDMLDRKSTVAWVNLLSLLPFGVLGKNGDFVESSCNIGVLRTEKDGLHIVMSSRSNDEEKLDNIVYILDNLAVLYGCELIHRDRYPGWKPEKNSRVVSRYREVYRELFGCEPSVQLLHAGLECGLVKNAIPDMDIISVGPTMLDIHTPRERLSLSSCDRFWVMLCAMLAK